MASESAVPQDERSMMREYWEEHTKNACTVEAMMLDSSASIIDAQERPEILGLLGDMTGKELLELGAGIGRFTSDLAEKCKFVTAIDFMPHLIEENRKRNAHFNNVAWDAADATKLDCDANSLDVVFSNWLLMYLADEEVKGLFRRALEWLRESGVLFFRESCFRQSGDKARKYNPTHYRSPADYFRMLEEVSTEVSPGRWACYEMDFCRSVESYVKVKGNQNQLAFRMRKVFRSTPHSEEPRFALDDGPCSMEALADLQRIHGSGFTETGGADFAKHLADMLGVSRDADALIVGCGAGGAAVALAQETGAQVQGMDASVNAFMTALQHSSSAKVPVGFETCVLTSRMPLHGVFDAVLVREGAMETMRHDMEAVALSLSRSIRHEGCVVLCDLVPAGEDPSKLSGHLHAAGFVAITCSDSSRIFLEHALSDLSRCKDLGLEAVEPRLADVVARLEAGDRLFVYQAERAGDTESSADDNESGTTVP